MPKKYSCLRDECRLRNLLRIPSAGPAASEIQEQTDFTKSPSSFIMIRNRDPEGHRRIRLRGKGSSMEKKRQEKKKKRDMLTDLAILLLGIVFVVSAARFFWLWQDSRSADTLYDRLAEDFYREDLSESGETGGSAFFKADTSGSLPAEVSNAQKEAQESASREEQVRARVAAMREENPDFVFWIALPEAGIDYPVMHTPADPEYYLHRDFEKNYNSHGTPFLDGSCQPDCHNRIIYGHHMRDNTVFSRLLDWRDPDYAAAHRTITLYTEEGIEEYETLWAMVMSQQDYTDFPFYQIHDPAEAGMRESYVRQCQKYACWSAGEDLQPGDRLISLVTCEYTKQNGRFILTARKKRE